MKPLLKNKTLLIVGAPGTGKGSYSKLLSKRFGFPVYSTGDHLRSLIKEPAEVNNKRLIDGPLLQCNKIFMTQIYNAVSEVLGFSKGRH